MIKKFFHGLNASKISYLLISGQASVLYGAASFSEDIDLWVEPEINNWNRFLRFLNSIKAVVYKLTPPITMKFILRGHGFHFRLLSKEQKLLYWFLDVMGAVPRARSFKQCYKSAIHQETDWGKLPVIGIRALVDIKKTRRLEDYSIISNLVRIEYERLISNNITVQDWRWILSNTFEIEDLVYFLSQYPSARDAVKSLNRRCVSCCLKAISGSKKRIIPIKNISRLIAFEIESLRENDRQYWKPIIKDLKTLNKNSTLLIPGNPPPKSVS